MSTVLVVENEINIRYSSMYIKYHKAQQERDFQTNLEYQFHFRQLAQYSLLLVFDTAK